MDKLIWTTEKRKLSELNPAEYNPRKATEKQIQDLTKSLDRFKLADPLIINQNNTIIGGHLRYQILKRKNANQDIEVDVRVPNRLLSKEEEKELNLRLNRNLGEWDFDLLANFDENFLIDVGFENEELDNIFGLDEVEFDLQKEFEKVVQKPKGVKQDDIWQLGQHKLIVGDATNEDIWKRLLNNEQFDFLFTDPPYRIGYGTSVRKQKTKTGFKFRKLRSYLGIGITKGNGSVDIKKNPQEIFFGRYKNRFYLESGQRGIPQYDSWLSIANKFQNSKGANIMVFENWKNTVLLWQALEKYWTIKNMVIWWALNRAQGFTAKHIFFNKYDIILLAGEGVLNEQYEQELDNYLKEKGQKLLDTYEIILYANQGQSYWDRKKRTRWARISDHITWTVDSEKQSAQNVIFGTKPVQILVPYIKILCPRNGIVVDCFAGSGSTIIACEIMKRQCRAIEIVPLYAEVLINRYEKFTGTKAVKLN